MKTKKKTIPQFESLDEEMEFWANHSPLDYDHRPVTLEEIRKETQQRLKKTSLTLELPEQDIKRLKKVAAKRGVSHQSLAAELLHKELAQTTA